MFFSKNSKKYELKVGDILYFKHDGRFTKIPLILYIKDIKSSLLYQYIIITFHSTIGKNKEYSFKTKLDFEQWIKECRGKIIRIK